MDKLKEGEEEEEEEEGAGLVERGPRRRVTREVCESKIHVRTYVWIYRRRLLF